MNGIEWLIEAFGCDESSIRRAPDLAALFEHIVSAMDLHHIGTATWHEFPQGGVTGVWLLKESHLAIHTFPEYRSACINVFCCKPRQPLDWHAALGRFLGATHVQVREHRRPYRMDD